MKNQNSLTAAERAAMEERDNALQTEASALAKALKQEETTTEVEETPVVVVEATDEVVEDAEENTENQEENEDDTVGIVKGFKWFLGIVGVLALVGILIMLMLMYFSKDNNQLPNAGTVNPNNGVVDTTPVGNEVPGTDAPVDTDVSADTDAPVEFEFDMVAFVASVENIAKTITTDENVPANVKVFFEKISEDKLVELVGEHGELSVQKAFAEFLVFVPEIKMNQYISNNGLDYNLKAKNDWYNKLDEAEAVYKKATGKNAEGAFMSLEGYDTFKDNREAMKAFIIKSGDTALLTWYEAKTTSFDLMIKQERDTEKAHAYKEEVKLELVNNVDGSVKLIELQLEQKINGTNADTLDYAEAYREFIINNYMYVVAN